MAIQQPLGTDPLNIPDHALSHRVFANDNASPDQSVVVDNIGNVLIDKDLTVNSNITGDTIIKSGGTSSQFLKADGTVDSSTYMNSMNITSVKTSNYSANVSEFVPCDISAGGFAITLPSAPADGSQITVKITKVDSTTVLEVKTSGTDVFNVAGGNTSIYLNLLNTTNELIYKASSGIWYNVSMTPASAFATGFQGVDAQTPISASNISIDYTTRVLTITPPLGYFYINTDGAGKNNRMRKTGVITFPAFTDTSGRWYFYFDITGVATVSQTPPDMMTTTVVYSLLWNNTLSGSAKVPL